MRQEVEQTLKRFHQQKRRFPSLKKERRLWVRLQANKRLWKRTLFLPSIHGQPVFSQDRRKIALIAKDRLVILDTLLPNQQQDILLKNAKKVAFSAQTNSINALEILQAKRLLHYHPILQLRSRGVFPGTLQHIAVQKARTLLVLRAKPNTTLFIHLRVRDTSRKLWRTTYKHIDGISWHPSKQTFIVWGLLSDKRYGVSLWRRTQSGTWNNTTRSLHSAITRVTWHPKKARVAFGHLDGHISIWNTTSLRERSRPGQLRCEILSLRYSHRGQLFSTDAQGRVYLWRPNKTHPRLILRVRKQSLSGMVLGPQGRRMLVMRKYKRSGDIRLVVSLWRLYSASTRKDAYVSPGALSVSVYHPNQQLAFSGGKDKIIRSWDLTTGAVNIQLEGHEYEIIHLVISRDGQWLVSGDRQGHILLWNLQQQRLVRRFHLHYHSPIALRFLESPRRILSVDASGRSVLFDVKTGHITEEKPLFQDGLQTTKLRWKMLPKSNILAAFKARRGIWLWALEESQRKFIKLPNLLHLDVSSHGRSFATLLQTRKGSRLQLWDIESNQHKDLALFPRQIHSLALRPNDKDIALFGRGVGILYNIRTQKRTQLRGVPPGFQALAWQFHPKGHLLTATGGVFQTRHWDVKTGMPLWYTIFFDRQRLRLLTHQGWEAIAPHKHPKPTRHKKWETRLHTHGWRASEHNELLCIHTRQDTLELWNKRLDQKLYTYKSRSLKKAIATPHGCFLLDKQQPLLITQRQTVDVFPYKTENIFWGGDVFVMTSGASVRCVNVKKTLTQLMIVERGKKVTSLLKTKTHFYVGFVNGRVSSLKHQSGFEKNVTPPHPHPVTALRYYKTQNILVVGYADGSLKAWQDNILLFTTRLHGSIQGIVWNDKFIYAVTDLGDYWRRNISILSEDACGLMRRMRKYVPVLSKGERKTSTFSRGHTSLELARKRRYSYCLTRKPTATKGDAHAKVR